MPRKRKKKLKEQIKLDLEDARDLDFVRLTLVRLAGFPDGLLLSTAIARPDGGVHNIVMATSELRRLAQLLTFKFKGWNDGTSDV